MTKTRRSSKRVSFNSLLDELISNPSDIDAALLGDIRPSTAKSSRMLSGQAELLEINAFIDANNRKPQSNSNDFNESKLARRMKGYAAHAKEHSDLKPFDKYELLLGGVEVDQETDAVSADAIHFNQAQIIEVNDKLEHSNTETDEILQLAINHDAEVDIDTERSSDNMPASDDDSYIDTDTYDCTYTYTAFTDELTSECMADAGKPFLAIGFCEDMREFCERITLDSMHDLPQPSFFIDMHYVDPERVIIQGGKHRTDISYLKPIYTHASLILKPAATPLVSSAPKSHSSALGETQGDPEPSLKTTQDDAVDNTDAAGKESGITSSAPKADHSDAIDEKVHTLDRSLIDNDSADADSFVLASTQSDEVTPRNNITEVMAGLATTSDTPLTLEEILIQDAELLAMLCAEDDEYFDAATIYSESIDRTTPDEIGKQTPCKDFYKFEGRFDDLHDRLKSGELETTRHTSVNFKQGDAFILNGVLGFIEQVGEYRLDNAGKYDPRLRLIFDNGTESNILLNTLNKSLFTDKQGRRVITPADEFSDFDAPGEVKKIRTGQVYIVKTLSNNPQLRAIPDLYKIGFTKHTVEERTKNASRDTAFLESPVEVVARAECYDLDPQGLEGIIHAFLYAQRIQITLTGKNGARYMPQEWFSINIKDAKAIIKHIVDGDILDYRMDNTTNKLVKIRPDS